MKPSGPQPCLRVGTALAASALRSYFCTQFQILEGQSESDVREVDNKEVIV